MVLENITDKVARFAKDQGINVIIHKFDKKKHIRLIEFETQEDLNLCKLLVTGAYNYNVIKYKVRQ